jgi:trimeric autotransporter adhesin
MGARRFVVPALILSTFAVAGCGSGSSNSSSNGQGNSNPLPAITSLTPSTVTAGAASTSLDVVGTGFLSASVLQWNGTSLTTTFTSATALSAELPASDLADGTTAKVTVVNPSPGGGTSAVATFTVNNPVPAVTAVSPGSALAGSGDATLDLTGSGFVSSSVVNWNGMPLTTTFVSGTEVKATLPLADQAVASASQITVANPAPAGGSSPQVAFDVNNPVPTITALTPATATAGAAATTVTVAGTNFVTTSAILWNGTALASTFVSATEMQASLPAADLASGAASQITAANPAPGGGASAALTFTVNNPVPAIKAISPANITAGAGATTLDITGTGFVPSSAIDWNGAALKTTFVSGTEVTAALPAANIGGSSVSTVAAVNPAPAGGTSAAVGFNVNSPAAVITALTPANVEQGSAATVTLTGTGFETNSVVSWNGQPRPTTFVSSTSVQVALTALDLESAGQGQLTVSNPDPNANTSLPAVLNITNIPVPAITGLTPSSIPANPAQTAATNVVITGTGFLPSALVQVNGQQVTTSAVSATSITVSLPASFITTAGALSFVVLNPNGPYFSVISNTFTLNVIGPPVISSITPSAAALGSADLQITVSATAIYADSSVLWNGTALTTTYVSTGGIYGGPSLTATIPAADLATLQGGTITVSSPEEAPTTTSAGQVFSVYLALQVNDLVINPVSGLLYASIPGAAGAMGNSVVGINPLTGAIVSQVSVGSEPTALAISGDGTQLYVGLNGAGAVRQVDLSTGIAGLQFTLGGGSGVYNPPFTAQGMAVLPGEPNSLAVYTSNGVLTIYDSGVARPNNSSSDGLKTSTSIKTAAPLLLGHLRRLCTLSLRPTPKRCIN